MAVIKNAYSLQGWLAALWGIIGVSGILLSACYRLGQHTVEAFAMGFGLWGWCLLVPWTTFMLVSEGYRGFQKAFSPRVAARARWLRANPGWLRGLLAPLFCMGFFGATRKRQIVTWCLTTGIICLVLLVRQLEQPWRGIIDLGVVAGLGWGWLSLCVFSVQALTSADYPTDPEIANDLTPDS